MADKFVTNFNVGAQNAIVRDPRAYADRNMGHRSTYGQTEELVVPALPNGHNAQGFTSDGTYGYMYHSLDDTTTGYMMKWELSTGLKLWDNPLTIAGGAYYTGHGNTLAFYDGNIYMLATNNHINRYNASTGAYVDGFDTFSATAGFAIADAIRDDGKTVNVIITQPANQSSLMIAANYRGTDYWGHYGDFIIDSVNGIRNGLSSNGQLIAVTNWTGSTDKIRTSIQIYTISGVHAETIYIDYSLNVEVEDHYIAADNSYILFSDITGRVFKIETPEFTLGTLLYQLGNNENGFQGGFYMLDALIENPNTYAGFSFSTNGRIAYKIPVHRPSSLNCGFAFMKNEEDMWIVGGVNPFSYGISFSFVRANYNIELKYRFVDDDTETYLLLYTARVVQTDRGAYVYSRARQDFTLTEADALATACPWLQALPFKIVCFNTRYGTQFLNLSL